MKLKTIKFWNYKGLRNFSISLQNTNILVGPNNCGKSTILSGLRILEHALRVAYARSPTKVYTVDGLTTYGHRLNVSTVPVSLENVHTDCAETDGFIQFRLANKSLLTLFFPAEGGCTFYWDAPGKPITTPGAVRQHFRFNIQVVPVLGPLEQEEFIVTDDTVRRATGTPRASRHFRNYWLKNPEGFAEFRHWIESTWTGMSIKEPEITSALERRLVMFYSEKRFERELYWAGFGFQIWCQLLTHISRSRDADLVLVDEPEVYLHPDVQRQLLGILRDLGPDIILATHSTEILAEADPSEILIVDKTKKWANRLKNVTGVQQALDCVGSVQNITLAHLARTRKILFVEGMNDYKVLRRFAKVLGLLELASGSELTALESGGYSSWERVRSLSWGLNATLGASIKIAAVYDRDYWCDDATLTVEQELREQLAVAVILKRKEIENYLLVPSVLNRAIEKALADKAKRKGDVADHAVPAETLLEAITSSMKADIQGQYVARYCEFYKKSGKDSGTLSARAIKIFDERWAELNARLELVPGKIVLRDFRSRVSAASSVTLTDIRIIDAFREDEIPLDLKDVLLKLNQFRNGASSNG